MHYGMVIDLKGCIGCHACAMACKMANMLPDGMWYNTVYTNGGESLDTPAGEFPNNTMGFLPVSCQHCEDPACVKVCPVGATYKEEGTGIVVQDSTRCIGCRMCMAACPYTGVRTYNWDEPKFAIDQSYGFADGPAHIKGTVEKCSFCHQRIARGEKPACMELCPGRVRFYGDLDDPDSEVSQLLRSRGHHRLMESQGTNPSVYYLD